MPPPRLQCLNGMRSSLGKASNLGAAFSTSSNVRAEGPRQPNPSSSTLPNSNNDTRFPTFARTAPPNAVNLPTGSRSNVDYGDGGEKTLRIAKLLNKQILRKERNDRDTRNQKTDPTSALSAKEEMQLNENSLALSKQITRRYAAGDVYAPHDLHWVEMQKWKARSRPKYDAFDALDMKPLDHYRNFSMVSEYMTPMGRIKHSKETGLRPVNQRRIARTIRRTIGMGLMPSVHKHPEILMKAHSKAQFYRPNGVR
ncbi:Ribosomal protein S18 [Glarea lozoyensis ATCC 20868]|uniref:Small ribosomal subunit protein bS18m n=1 Tax=Glarea lozoyensis (strain ATCC 20868 / MF5171) TaxID=1116229 RepID=S3DTS1_GLAL2|nr:Ribosomal protein S18 [Glarea lozoyensis ATCC 20868]EPE35321.1 Ribosomal protein S18 [Glarea lozoyensis ATCC 20868]